jgi:hypothetical protein
MLFEIKKKCVAYPQGLPFTFQMAAPIFVGVFETIDRELLLWKMEQYGMRDAELEWFRSYLSDISQEIKFYSKVSEAINFKLGVPRGS